MRHATQPSAVEELSSIKDEPRWMRDYRTRSLEAFLGAPSPDWDVDLSGIDFDAVFHAALLQARSAHEESVLATSAQTFNRLRRDLSEAEDGRLVSLGAQQDAETLFEAIKRGLRHQGVIFTDMDTAVRKHPDLIREHLGTVVPITYNRLAALNGAVWSGGSFVHVPRGVEVAVPLQGDFRLGSQSVSPFERTLIVAEPGSSVHYIEGCAAPIYTPDPLRGAVVEVVVKEGAHVRYTALQNWSLHVHTLTNKYAVVHGNATMEWVEGILGSKVTRRHPGIRLAGPKAEGMITSVAFAAEGQDQDAGGEIVFAAPGTSGAILSRAVITSGGQVHNRGHTAVRPEATDTRVNADCEVLRLDRDPHAGGKGHGPSGDEAARRAVVRFIEPAVRRLPLEYGVELDRLVQLHLDGVLG